MCSTSAASAIGNILRESWALPDDKHRPLSSHVSLTAFALVGSSEAMRRFKGQNVAKYVKANRKRKCYPRVRLSTSDCQIHRSSHVYAWAWRQVSNVYGPPRE